MKNKRRLSIVVLALAMVVLISTAVAYFTDIDTVDNVFTIGKVEIGLEEPDWTPEEHTKITPNETIEKDPTITNTGINDAFVFDKYGYLTVFVRFKGYFVTVNGYQVKIVFFVLFSHLFSFRP